MIRVDLDLPDQDAAADLVDVLLAAAESSQRRDPSRAALWRRLADGIGDGLDVLDQLCARQVTP